MIDLRWAKAFLADPYKAPEQKADVAKRFGLTWPPKTPDVDAREPALSDDLEQSKDEVMRLRGAMKAALAHLRAAMGPNTVPEERAIRTLEEALKRELLERAAKEVLAGSGCALRDELRAALAPKLRTRAEVDTEIVMAVRAYVPERDHERLASLWMDVERLCAEPTTDAPAQPNLSSFTTVLDYVLSIKASLSPVELRELTKLLAPAQGERRLTAAEEAWCQYAIDAPGTWCGPARDIVKALRDERRGKQPSENPGELPNPFAALEAEEAENRALEAEDLQRARGERRGKPDAFEQSLREERQRELNADPDPAESACGCPAEERLRNAILIALRELRGTPNVSAAVVALNGALK